MFLWPVSLCWCLLLVPWLVPLAGAFGWCLSLVPLAGIMSCAFYCARNPSCGFYRGGDCIVGLTCADCHGIASCRLAS